MNSRIAFIIVALAFAVCESKPAIAAPPPSPRSQKATTSSGQFQIKIADKCTRSRDCVELGLCSTNKKGECVAKTNTDCRQAVVCRGGGKCQVERGKCIPSQYSCRYSTGCKKEGLCIYGKKECTATNVLDCLASVGCWKFGKCHHQNGKCVALFAEDCRRSFACKVYGSCSLHERDSDCAALKNRDCLQSRNCRILGRCKADQHVTGQQNCIPSPAGCRRSQICKKFGYCSWVKNLTISYGRCGAATNADCQQSTDCDLKGLCSVQDGGCITKADADCQRGKICSYNGLCSAKNGKCVATSTRDCRRAKFCKEQGYCSLKDGICRRLSDKDCQGSKNCKLYGNCHLSDREVRHDNPITGLTYYNKICIARDDADCRQAVVCRTQKKCYTTQWGRCVTKAEEEDSE